jgi:hypothetical protein
VLACKDLGSYSSPTTTFKAFFEAQKQKDVPGIKKTLSKGSIAMIGHGAEERKKTLDDALKEGFDDPAFKAPSMPPIRNEKIDGDSATLEVQNEENKSWETMYFVKEDSEWKIALDKTLEELFKKMGK